MSPRMISVYLRDHAAVAAGGVELARRAAAGNEGSDFGRYARTLAAELERHDAALERAMAALEVSPGRLKRTGARIGERMGRLKLNGRLVSKSPLSPVTEAEGLLAVLGAHLLVWEALGRVAGPELPREVDPGSLADSARRHMAELDGHRLGLLEAAVAG